MVLKNVNWSYVCTLMLNIHLYNWIEEIIDISVMFNWLSEFLEIVNVGGMRCFSVLQVLNIRSVGRSGEQNQWLWLSGIQSNGVPLVNKVLYAQWQTNHAFRMFCNKFIKKILTVKSKFSLQDFFLCHFIFTLFNLLYLIMCLLFFIDFIEVIQSC